MLCQDKAGSWALHFLTRLSYFCSICPFHLPLAVQALLPWAGWDLWLIQIHWHRLLVCYRIEKQPVCRQIHRKGARKKINSCVCLGISLAVRYCHCRIQQVCEELSQLYGCPVLVMGAARRVGVRMLRDAAPHRCIQEAQHQSLLPSRARCNS